VNLDNESNFPKFEMLPKSLKWLCIKRGEHFGKNSAKYNNILCIGSTGVENGKGGGYERVIGDHAVKMSGRSHHFLSSSNRRMCGINFFRFDGRDNAQLHVKSLNSSKTTACCDI
jgi:hypothetical protein